MKLVLFSDLHLDATFAWVGAEQDVARRWRCDLRDTLIRILQLAYDVGADAVLCGGDLYEHERFTPDTAAFLRNELAQCAPLPIYIAPGNHDFYGPRSLYETTDWSGNVHIFDKAELAAVALDDGITLWGAAHIAPAGTGDFLRDFASRRGGINLALLHATELGWWDAQDESKVAHAPFRADEIERAGLDHAFLGHLHSPRHAPQHTYPGNPNPLAFGEAGVRGAVVATVRPDGSVERDTHVVSTTSLHDVSVDVTDCASLSDVRERVAAALAALDGIARVTLTGELAVAVDLRVADLLPPEPAMDAVIVRTGGVGVAYDFGAMASEPTVRGQFVKSVLESELSDEQRRRILVTGLRALDGRRDLEVV